MLNHSNQNHSNQLCVEARSAAFKAMKERELDVLIVGGGITGTGAALDAASRGLSVGLIEKGDLASGTSSKSSKMIHGGLRYLEQMRLGLVREALFERGLLLKRIAPHLVRPYRSSTPCATDCGSDCTLVLASSSMTALAERANFLQESIWGVLRAPTLPPHYARTVTSAEFSFGTLK